MSGREDSAQLCNLRHRPNHDLYSETNVDMKDVEIKLNGNNLNKLNKEQINDEYDETDDDNDENKKKSFFRLCCSENLEKDIAEQSKVMLNMIYFFQPASLHWTASSFQLGHM